MLQARAPDTQDLDHALSADYIISHHPGAGDGRAKADGVAVFLVSSQHHCSKPSHSHCQQEMRHTLGKAADSNTAGQCVPTGHSVGSHVPPSATRAGMPQGRAMNAMGEQTAYGTFLKSARDPGSRAVREKGVERGFKKKKRSKLPPTRAVLHSC